MTLGELVDKLDAVEMARLDIEEAKLSIEYGGNEDTMKWKRENLRNKEDWLDHLRSEELKL